MLGTHPSWRARRGAGERRGRRNALGRAPASALGWLPHCTYVAALLEVGDAEQASAVILAQAGGAELAAIEPGFRLHGYELLVHAELACGGSRRQPAGLTTPSA